MTRERKGDSEAIEKAISSSIIGMDSVDLPSSSDPPERGREGQVTEEVLVESTVTGDIDLKKGAQSWASKATDKRALKKYDVEIISKDGKNKVEIPDEIVSESTPLWEEFVVGKFLDLAPHIAKVHMVVNKIWNYGELNAKVEVYDVDAKTMRFKISNVKAREKVIRRGMWNIAGVPMIVKKWTPKAEEEMQEEESIPMWVHLRKVPIHAFSWEALSFITSTVGYPVRLHPETIACSNFEEAKVFVKVDVSKTLPKEIDFMMGGKEFTAEFYYPWLPSRCAHCEKWGHNEKVCALKMREQRSGKKEKTEIVVKSGNLKSLEEAGENKEAIEKVLNDNSVMKNLLGVEVMKEAVMDTEKSENDWSVVAPDKVGRAHTPSKENEEVIVSASKFTVLSMEEVEEGEVEAQEVEDDVSVGVESMEGRVGEDMEEDFLDQEAKEMDKVATQKGGRKVQKTRAQEVKPRSKRSSRRKL